MAKTKISEFNSNPALNTDIDSINLAEGCAPSGINDAIRELMSQLKDWQSGTSNDPMVIGSSGSLTLNQGTANGVAYLNGSKVVTSGSALTFDGTNLGVGTSSPSVGLDVTKTGVRVGTTTAYKVTSSRDSTPNKGVTLGYDSGSQTGIIIGDTNSASSNLAFWTYEAGVSGWAERMRLDSSGNLGLGVTPSVWNSSAKAIQNSAGALWQYANSYQFLGQNYYFNSSGQRIYLNNAAATEYTQVSGSHSWSTAPSGTAGNAISFTQAMTLDASGNLLVGTTSNGGGKLEVKQSANNEAGIWTYSSSTDSNGRFYCDNSVVGIAASYSSTGSYLPIVFKTSNTERARIDSSGNLLVGTTSTSVTNGAFVLRDSGAINSYMAIGHKNGSNSGADFLALYYNGTQIGGISQSGTTAVLFNVTSDQRLKENIVDAPEFGSVIDSIKVRSYDWKADGNHQRAGFVAQELITVAPEAVHQPVDTEQMMAVDYSKLVPMLVKEIQSLRARVAQLESN